MRRKAICHLAGIVSLVFIFSFVSPARPVPSVQAESPADIPGGMKVYVMAEATSLADGVVWEPKALEVSGYGVEGLKEISSLYAAPKTEGSAENGTGAPAATLAPDIAPLSLRLTPDSIAKLNRIASERSRAQIGSLSNGDYAEDARFFASLDTRLLGVEADEQEARLGPGSLVVYHYSLSGDASDISATRFGAKRELIMLAADAAADPASQKLLSGSAKAAYAEALRILSSNVTPEEIDLARANLEDALSEGSQRPQTCVDVSARLYASVRAFAAARPNPQSATYADALGALAASRAGFSDFGYFQRFYNDYLALDAKSLNSSGRQAALLALAVASLDKDPAKLLDRLVADEASGGKAGIQKAALTLMALDGIQARLEAKMADPDTEDEAIGEYSRQSEELAGRKQALISYLTSQAGSSRTLMQSDAGLSGMILAALGPYMSQPGVAGVAGWIVASLSASQAETGVFLVNGTPSLEGTAWAVIGLCAANADPATDSRFVKARGNGVTGLLTYYDEASASFRVAPAGEGESASEETGEAEDEFESLGASALLALAAYRRYSMGEAGLIDLSDGFGAGTLLEASDTPALYFTAPTRVSNKKGASFNVNVYATGWPAGEWKLLDGILNIPPEFTVAEVSVAAEGASLTWFVSETDKKLRFVYTDTSKLATLAMKASRYPALIMTIRLAVAEDVDIEAIPYALISCGGVTLKSGSRAPMFVFDITRAWAYVDFSYFAISVRELYRGDGTELIPTSRKAMAIEISTPDDLGRVEYKGIPLLYSEEFSLVSGLPVFLLMADITEPASEMDNPGNYETLPSFETWSIHLGDTDGNGTINAQDCTEVIALWLRAKPIASDVAILVANVTGDAHLDTFDALAIMEFYISGIGFPILLK